MPATSLKATGWLPLSALSGAPVGTAMYVQNQGGGPLLSQESATAPAVTDNSGVLTLPGQSLTVASGAGETWVRSSPGGPNLYFGGIPSGTTLTAPLSLTTAQLYTTPASSNSGKYAIVNGSLLARSNGTNWLTVGSGTALDPALPVPVDGLKLNTMALSGTVGDTGTLTATISPATATNKAVRWESSDPRVVTVDQSGNYKVVGAGVAYINVLALEGNFFSWCVVTATASGAVIVPDSVTISPKPVALTVGGSQQLTATVSPTSSTNKAVTWSSSAPGIVSVSSSGLASAVAAGTAVITATTTSGGRTDTASFTITAVVAQLKAAGVWNPMNDTVTTAAAGLTTFYVPVKMRTPGSDLTSLTLDFPAWYTPNTNTGQASDLGNDLNILEASLQSSTTSAPVTFSGARTGLVPNGGNLVSDAVSAAALGFTGGVIPANTDLWMKVKGTIPSGGKIPGSPRNLYGQSNISGWLYDSTATTVPSVDALANSTSGYSGTKPADAGNLYAPVLVGLYKDPTVKAFASWGDSIGSGYNDLSRGYLGGGAFQRRLSMFTVVPGSINFAVSGAKSQSLSTDARIKAWFKYVPDGLEVMVGTNDFGITSPPTAASIIANIDTFNAFYKGAPGVKSGVKVVVNRLLPRTTSTDSFVTEANQSINANWNPGEVVAQFNALITTSKYDAVIVNDVVRGTDVSKWIVNGTAKSQTDDGTHPNGSANGTPLLASTYYPITQTAWA